ncbi:HAMP domain-containing sensor histidine kinase [Roseateles amylovorans]|uniref:histidine kinase n=1 Tax=Roseateles amylovorans TaxID=2978473 RepID=A0ABY6AWP4_9BURK|nr:ATP-binding protein [Roseateles amylovorans]UXH77230.1 ATP-binding protein [Roseateles amylovorans]
MAGTRRTGRLFWKFFLSQWAGMTLTLVCVTFYFHLTGRRPPPNDAEMMLLFGLVPVVPLGSVLVTMLLTSAGLAWYLSRPIRHLSWALHRVAEGHLDTRVQDRMGRRNDEIVDLAGDFDRMARQLQQVTESRNLLLHDISHELRSPLARLQLAIGLLRQSPEQTDAMLDRIERESQRLDALIEELLTWHRLEAGAGFTPASRIDVLDLLQAIAEDAQFEAQAQGKSLRLEAQGQFVAEVHGELIYRAFENVIRNAIKFTSAGSEVQVRVEIDAATDSLNCWIEDQGPGVPPDMLDRIFEPFARVAGSENVQGVGLGLAIAQRAFALHGGEIRAQARPGGGLTMRMALPRSHIYPA